jgi:hypothetical protein
VADLDSSQTQRGELFGGLVTAYTSQKTADHSPAFLSGQ